MIQKILLVRCLHLLYWVFEVLREKVKLFSLCMHVKSLQLCPALCDPMDCSPPDSSVHGILWVRILEWVATTSSKLLSLEI